MRTPIDAFRKGLERTLSTLKEDIPCHELVAIDCYTGKYREDHIKLYGDLYEIYSSSHVDLSEQRDFLINNMEELAQYLFEISQTCNMHNMVVIREIDPSPRESHLEARVIELESSLRRMSNQNTYAPESQEDETVNNLGKRLRRMSDIDSMD